MSQKLSVNEFAEHISAAVNVGEKIDTLILRLDELSRDVRDILQKLNISAHDISSEPKLLYTAAEVAEQLSVHVKTVRLYIRFGYLPVRRLGGAQRIHRKDLEAISKNGLPKVWPNKPWPEERAKKRKP